MTKKLLFIFFIIFFIFLILFSNNFTLTYFKKFAGIIRNYVPESVYSTLLVIFDNNRNSKRISNDYNVVFLPKTQFVNLKFKKLGLDFLEAAEGGYLIGKQSLRKTFFLEIYNDKIFFLDTKGSFYYDELASLKEEKINYKKIKTNLKANKEKENLFDKILDFHVFKDKVFVSKIIKNNECLYLQVDVAEINLNELIFNNIFTSQKNNECIKNSIQAGKIEMFSQNELIITTGGDILINKDESDSKPQDENSLFGKVLLINIDNSDYKIFNKGHRNSLGLLVDGDFIFSTENGPRGGDEINLELKGKNYGWDIASYGKKYSVNESYLDHGANRYSEPIFSFVPSIGIAEIIKLANNFTPEWQDNYLISSLQYKHLLRVKFSKNKDRVIFIEQIFIGERIRDLAYNIETKIIVLALEDTGSLGILYKG